MLLPPARPTALPLRLEGVVAALSHQRFAVSPADPTLVRRLAIETVLPRVYVTSVRLAREELLGASVFASGEIGLPERPLFPGSQLCVTVENTSARAVTFSAEVRP